MIIPSDMGPALAACAGSAFFIAIALRAVNPERKAIRAKRRAAREEFERRVIADEIDQRNKANLDRALAMTRPPMKPGDPEHPLMHQRQMASPRRRPARISLEGAARRLIEDEDKAVLEAIGDENTGPLPRHLARSGWSA